MQKLKQQLGERDRRLEEQAASLADMEQSVQQLSAILPSDGLSPGTRNGSLGDEDDHSAAQLRQMLREKNEKISLLTAEFDAHRADFRSTLDSLEMASTETERVYEEQKRDLLAQLAEMQEMGQSKEDFEGVAQQLKQLEDLVAELEEGLEESRRGEAEARGEVEFLRGEVERGRSELRREREKAAAALRSVESGGSNSPTLKELEAKDDEIRGLKAIVHNLSSNPSGSTDGSGVADEEVQKLRDELEDSQREKEDLEKELEQLRRDSAMTNGTNGHTTHARNESERTATAPDSGTPARPRADTVKPTFAEHARRNGVQDHETNGSSGANGTYCEMCESSEHDTLDCTKLSSSNKAAPQPDSPGKENEHASAAVGGKGGAVVVDEDKWCALCEKGGHLAFDCPEEQY